jgi:hypothetical protein
VQGTNVPPIDPANAQRIQEGPQANTMGVRLGGQVGVLAVIRKSDRSVAEAMLVWIPGGDQAASNQLYRDAFDVFLRTLNPTLDEAERASIASTLGLSPQAPPFPVGSTATAEAVPHRYTRSALATPSAVVISAVDSRPR